MLDGWIVNTYDNVFGQVEENEQIRESGIAQIESPRFAATNLTNIFLQDAMRKQVTKQDIVIQEKQYNHRSFVVAKGQYKFKNDNGCVVYQKQYCGDSGSTMLIVELPGSTTSGEEYTLYDIGYNELKLKYENKRFNVSFGELSQELEGFKTYMIHTSWNHKTMTSELKVYEYIHPNDVPIYRLRPGMYYFDFENPICELVGIYNNDYSQCGGVDIQLHTYPVLSTNFKVYNTYLNKEEQIKESIKYTTNHENCIVNDLARLIDDGFGYAVK